MGAGSVQCRVKQSVDAPAPAVGTALAGSFSKVWDRIGREAFLMLAGQALSALAGLISVRLLTTYFSREVYGLSWLFINGVTLASLLTAGALGQAFSRFYHDDDAAQHIDNLLGLTWRLQLLVTVVVSLLYLAVVGVLGHAAGGEKFAVWVMPVYFFFLSFLTISQLVLNAGRKRMKRALLTVLDAWLKPCGALLLCFLWKSDVNAFVVGYAATTVLLGLAGIFCLGQFGSGASLFSLPMPDKELIRRIVGYSAPLAAITVVTWVLALSDRYIVNWQLGPALTGTYVAAYQVGSALFQLLGGAFGPLVQPIVFRRGSKSLQAGGDSIALCYRAFAWLSIPLLVLFMLIYQWMMRWLVAPSYWSGMTAVLWVGLGTYMWILGNVGMDAFQVSKRNGPLLLIIAVCALINIGMNLMLVKSIGIVGAGIATAVSYTLYAGGIIVIGKKILPYSFPCRTFFTVAVLSGVAGLVGKGAHLFLFNGNYDEGAFIGVVLVFLAAIASLALLFSTHIKSELRVIAKEPVTMAASA